MFRYIGFILMAVPTLAVFPTRVSQLSLPNDSSNDCRGVWRTHGPETGPLIDLVTKWLVSMNPLDAALACTGACRMLLSSHPSPTSRDATR